MDISKEIEDDEESGEDLSPIIQIFERLTFERGQDIHDHVSSMIDLFSLSDVTLDMLDILIDCVKIILVHPEINKNLRIFDFLITLTHVTHINYTSNKNLSLVFDALIDIFSQTMIATDSQIRYTTLRILNKIQSFIDLSRSPYVPDQFEQYLLELLNNETTLIVIDQIIPLAAKFQHKNSQFIDAFLSRISSSKWNTYVDRRRQIICLIEYSSSSLEYLLTIIENDNELFQIAFESLLSDERGFTLDKFDIQTRLIIFKIASQSRDLSRLIFTRWISQNKNELIHIIQLCQIATLNDRLTIEKALKYFLDDENIRQIVANNTKIAIGDSKGGLLPSNVSNYLEHLFIWRILCEIIAEEDDDTDIHPDFHEFITYFYRLLKSSVNQNLSLTKQYLICQYASILSTYDMLDIYRRKCIEATGRCMLVHFGQYEKIIEQAFYLIHRIHSSSDTIHERYQLVTYTLNDIIQRCQNEQSEKLAFIQCMIITKVFIEQEKTVDLKYTDFKQLTDSLIKSGLSHQEFDIQLRTLSTLHTLMSYSRPIAVEYLKKNLHMTSKIDNISLKCQSLSTFINVLLIHGLDLLTNINLTNLTPTQFLTEYFVNIFEERNNEIKNVIIHGLIKLFLSSRLEPNISLLKILLDYRFSNDYRSINQQQRDEITTFFYFFIHLSISNVLLIDQLTYDLISHCLPFVSDQSTTIAYKSILTEQMCSFCIELLSLPTLPVDQYNNNNNNKEYSHYNLAKNLLQSIHNTTNNRTTFIIKSYLNTIKHLQFQYMNKQQLEVIFDLINQLRQYPNMPMIIPNLIKHIEEQIQSCLKLVDKLTNGNNDSKRPRSPSLTSPMNAKRISSSFNPSMTSSPNILRDRTNQTITTNENRSSSSSSKGIKRKLNSNRYSTLDFENDTDDFF